MLEKTLRMGDLLAWYGTLLTEKQRDFFDLYYHQDLSLSEIADEFKISRPAVADNLHRAQEHLEHYEQALGLLARQEAHRKVLQQVDQILQKSVNSTEQCLLLQNAIRDMTDIWIGETRLEDK
jgi:hypothetical protein